MDDVVKTKDQPVDGLKEPRRKIAEMEGPRALSREDEGVPRGSETVYRKLFETSRDGIVIFDADTGRIDEVNPHLLKMLGYTFKDLIGKRFWEMGTFRNMRANKSAFKQLQETGYARYDNLEFRTRDNRLIPVECVCNAYTVHNRRVIQCTVRDINDKKWAGQGLKESEGLFSTLAQMLPVGIFRTDTEGHCVYVNRQWFDITGLSDEETFSKEWAKALHPNDAEKVISGLKKTISKGVPFKSEFRFMREDGVMKWVLGQVVLQQDGKGGKSGYIGTLTDITELKEKDIMLQLNETRFQGLFRISQFKAKNIQDLLDFVLDQALILTKSTIGYVYLYNEETKEFTLNTWSKEVMKACTIANPKTIYHLDKTGIWGEVVRQRKPIVLNDFQAPNPLKKGYPQGHAPLNRYLTIPVFHEGKIVAVVAVANKETDYDQSDVLQLKLLMDSAWKIVESRKVEEALSRKTEELDRFFSVARDLLCIANTEGRFLRLNAAWEKTLGYPIAELEGKEFMALIHHDDKAKTKKAMSKLARQEEINNFINRYLCKDGTYRWIEWNAASHGDIIYAAARDITKRIQMENELKTARTELEKRVQERTAQLFESNKLLREEINRCKLIEEELKDSQERLRYLSVHLQKISETERSQLARELHDELGQVLTGIKMDISWMIKHLPEANVPVTERARSLLSVIDTIIQAIQRMSMSLRPVVLDDFGLNEAIRIMIKEFEKKTDIAFTFISEPHDMILDKNISTEVFRIFQEGITNVIRHANAKNVTIFLRKKKDRLVMEIRDDGKGITREAMSNPHSIGLTGMRERTYVIRGSLTIKSAEGKGTTLTLNVPLVRGH